MKTRALASLCLAGLSRGLHLGSMEQLPLHLSAALADRYSLDRELGRGGMATVYLAQDLKHQRKVALKVLRPELAAALGSERFLREITLTAGLHHPHILPLLDSGEARGGPGPWLYYVMPYVEGESLRDRLTREKQLPLEDALQIAREVADALSYAHTHGVIHRDIKPENILLEGSHAMVADFGIARAITTAGTARLTETGMAVGTPAYMSPEQAAGDPDLDGRSDLYALGCVLYEMLAGEPPFTGASAQAVVAKRLSTPAPRISILRDRVPAFVEQAIDTALARTPADRFATAAKFREALAADAGSAVTAPRPVARQARARRAGIGVIALILIAGGLWMAGRRQAPAAADSGVTPANSTAIALDPTAIAVLPFRVVGADSASPAYNLAMGMGDLFEIEVTGEFGRHIRHPGSVAQRWRAAGGTPGVALSEEAERTVARAVGAGRLVRGTVVATGDSLVLSASMVNVATGVVRVLPQHVNGTQAQATALADRLIILLLARDAGISPEEAPRLAHFKPEAIQALLAGNRVAFKEQNALYHAALAADSNLVDAALAAYAVGEWDTAALRFAWQHQDRLTERGRAALQAYAGGRYGGIHTMAQVIGTWEALTRRWPEWSGPWGELGEKLWKWGALASAPDWRRRAQAAFARIDPPLDWYRWEVTELAFLEGDTARIRAAIDTQAAYESRSEDVQGYRWRLAILEDDTAEATRVLSQLQKPQWVYKYAIADGRGVAQVDRLVASRMDDVGWWWGWARGRERMWWEDWRRWDVPASDIQQAAVVYQALLLGPSQDRRVEKEVRNLERMAAGSSVPPADADDQAMARCWVAFWRLQHGDTTGARATRRYLESNVGRGQRFVGWARLIDALLTEAEGGDVHAALLRMDSVVREVPLPDGYLRWLPMPVEVQNLFLARMLRRYGEPTLALTAARRRQYGDPGGEYAALPEYLREEGRLAAQLGDTAGAVSAYRHYLALRENPDPPWRPPWDSVRAELAALVGP